MTVDRKHNKASTRYRPLIATLIACTFLLIAVWIATTLITLGMYKGDLAKASQLGDAYGVANSLFSALAFGGIIVTIWLQSNELRLQRRELRMQRRESKRQRQQMEKSAIAQENSEKALNLQADSLLLSAYLSALSSVRESYARSGSNRDIDEEHKIRQVIATIAEQIAPRIQHIAESTMKEHAPQPSANTQERERRHHLAQRIRGISTTFSIKWKSSMDSRMQLRTEFAFRILTELKCAMELISSEIPKQYVDEFVFPLQTVNRLLADITTDQNDQFAMPTHFFQNAGIECNGLAMNLESVATNIENSIPSDGF